MIASIYIAVLLWTKLMMTEFACNLDFTYSFCLSPLFYQGKLKIILLINKIRKLLKGLICFTKLANKLARNDSATIFTESGSS